MTRRTKAFQLFRLLVPGGHFVRVFWLRQQFELDFARVRADGFLGVVAGEFLERAAQDVVAVVALGFSRSASELALEFIPDAVERACSERNVVALDVGPD